MDIVTVGSRIERLSHRQVENRLQTCPRLPSLGSIHSALSDLLAVDQSYTSHISEVIRRDPSLTARLLRLVNSVYFGLTVPVDTIEEAVFYLGIRQIRQLAVVTPVIEDFQRLAGNYPFAWREFWRHCIGTAIMAREVLSSVRVQVDETDYVAGLVHDVGKIVMAAVFPCHFAAVQQEIAATPQDLPAVEQLVLGLDHCELGGLYLAQHQLPEVMIQTARFHHQPEKATQHGSIVAAVQVADMLVRQAGIGCSGNPAIFTPEAWIESRAWHLLFPNASPSAQAMARANLHRTLGRLPMALEGLV